MAAEAVALADPPATENLYDEAKRRLTDEIQRIAEDNKRLGSDRSEWEPLLDSRQIVGIVLILEDVFQVRLPPDQLVRKGGYNDVGVAVDDIIQRHKKLATVELKKART